MPGAPGRPAEPAEVMLTGRWQAPFPVDLARTAGGAPARPRRSRLPGRAIRRGLADLAHPGRPGHAAGHGRPAPGMPPATAARWPVTARPVLAWAWGPGAAWLLAALPGPARRGRRPGRLRPVHPLLREMDRRLPGICGSAGRAGSSRRWCPPCWSRRSSARRHAGPGGCCCSGTGSPPPGPAPAGMRVFPPARTWARIPSWEWHRAGVEAVRARTIIGAAQVAERLEEIAGMTPAEADRGCGRCPASAPGPRPRSGSGPAATPTRSRSATTTCPGWSAGRWPARTTDDAGHAGAARALRRAPAPRRPPGRAQRQAPAAPRARDGVRDYRPSEPGAGSRAVQRIGLSRRRSRRPAPVPSRRAGSLIGLPALGRMARHERGRPSAPTSNRPRVPV